MEHKRQTDITCQPKQHDRYAELFINLTLIVASWLSLVLMLSGLRIGYHTLRTVGLPPLSSLVNLSGPFALIKLSGALTFIDASLAVFSGLVLQISAFSLGKGKPWGLSGIVLATSCCFIVYAIELFFLGFRLQLFVNTTLFITTAYLYSVPLLNPIRKRFGLQPSAPRDKIGFVVFPLLILLFTVLCYEKVVETFISSKTFSIELSPFPDTYMKWHDKGQRSYTWDDKWSFYIPDGMKKQSGTDDHNARVAAWKTTDNFILLSFDVVSKTAKPPYFRSPYEYDRSIWSAGYWGGFNALGMKEVLSAPSTEVYDLDWPDVKAIICLEYRPKADTWVVKANIYRASEAAITYTSTHRSKNGALDPLLMTLNEYQKGQKNSSVQK